MNRELWAHQAQGIADLRATIGQGVKRVVAMAPTGAGKTAMAAAIVEGALAKGNRVAFVVPAIGLIDQTVQAFYAEGIDDVGVMQADHPMSNPSRAVQVCSIQTLNSRRQYPDARLVIIDECHQLHDFHKHWMSDEAWKNVPFIGLSATPWSKGLGKHFETLLTVATTQELIDGGFLSPFQVYCTGRPDLSEVEVKVGEYVKDQLSDAMLGGTLTADIVRTWQELWGKGKTLVFGVDRKHAETIHHRFIEVGVKSAYQDGETPAAERAVIKKGFHDGTYDVVCNIGTLTTGVDWDVRCLVLARPTKSEILYTQIIGRALRTAPGKDKAVILDHSNSTLELGLVTDIHHEHLDDGKKADKAKVVQKKKVLPRECPECHSIIPRLNRTCTQCGHTLPLATGVVEKDGVLVPYDDAMATQAAKRKADKSERQMFYSQLLGYSRGKGYKDGWAANKFRDKFGCWPDGLSKISVEPSFEVASWIKSQLIRWIRGKEAAAGKMRAAE